MDVGLLIIIGLVLVGFAISAVYYIRDQDEQRRYQEWLHDPEAQRRRQELHDDLRH